MTALTVRRPSREDADDVLALCRDFDVALLGESEWTLDDLLAEWDELDLARDAWLVFTGDRLGGYAAFENRGEGRLMADGYVHPDLVGRGIGTMLVELTEGRARDEAAAIRDAHGDAVLQNAVLQLDAGAHSLLERLGYREVRQSFRMAIDLADRPLPPDGIPGVLIDRFEETRARELYEVVETAFAQEWGHRRQEWEEWRKRWLSGPWYDQGLWWTASSGDSLVGAIICRERFNDAGWVSRVGVLPDWRGRGIGGALLQTAFRGLYDRGERRIALGVDAANPTGATRVYERVGMRVSYAAAIFEKAMYGQ